MISIFSSQILKKEPRLKAIREKVEKMRMEIVMIPMVMTFEKRFLLVF
jgi:hypothetical protein